MQKPWAVGVVLAVALALCPAVEAEQISAKLLEEAKERAANLERLISAAKQGDAEAQFDLGVMISREGRGYVNREAQRNQHHSQSNRELAWKIRDLAAIKAAYKEVQEAELEWFLRAALQGHDAAQWMLIRRYEYTDIVRAYAWNRIQFRKHGRDGTSRRDGVEKPMADRLRTKMTDDQVAEALELSHQLEREIQRGSNTRNQ